jgi:hypothetical protein
MLWGEEEGKYILLGRERKRLTTHPHPGLRGFGHFLRLIVLGVMCVSDLMVSCSFIYSRFLPPSHPSIVPFTS